jgi:hypothetical protein
MSKVIDAFWRAIGYCLLPRVMFLSLLPVLLLGTLAAGLAWFFWDPAVEAVRVAIVDAPLLGTAAEWLDRWTGGAFRSVIGPLVVVVLAVPLLIIGALLLVSAVMGSMIIGLVGRRRFEALERRGGAPWWRSFGWMLGSVALALGVLVVTLPLWLIPPLALLLPPLILGWLTYRVMAWDALSEHADADERRLLLRRHRPRLLVIGVVCGYLGAAPSLVWAFGVLTLPMMPLLVPVFVWLYTLVEVFAALWFAHYMLDALDTLRRGTSPGTTRPEPVEITPVVVAPPPALPSSSSTPPTLP